MPPKKPAPKTAKVKPLDFSMPEEKTMRAQADKARFLRAASAMPTPGPIENRAAKRVSKLIQQQTAKFGKNMPNNPQADREYSKRGGPNSFAIADREYSKRLAAGKEKVATSDARLKAAGSKIAAKASKPAKLPDYGLPGTVSKPSKTPAARPAPAPKAPSQGGLPPAKLNARVAGGLPPAKLNARVAGGLPGTVSKPAAKPPAPKPAPAPKAPAKGGLPGTVDKKAAGEAKLDRLIGPRNPGRGGLPSSGGGLPSSDYRPGGGGGGGGRWRPIL